MIYLDSCYNDNIPSNRDDHADQAIHTKSNRRRTQDDTSTQHLPTVALLRGKDDHRTPLRHLQGKERRYYESCANPISPEDVFGNELELFNRKSVRKLLKPHPDGQITDMCEYFFDNVGRAKVTFKLCIECRDLRKPRSSFDDYYMDLVEISQQRTILCAGCMTSLIQRNIGSESVKDDLEIWRKKQPNGVYVDPYLMSCGY